MNNEQRSRLLFVCAFTVMCSCLHAVELPKEIPLWEGAPDFPLKSDAEEAIRSPKASKSSPSGSNRVFSFVTKPTYTIHRADKPNGVGIVICPGGGYNDVWLDREGHDLALWLKEQGITSLVLKYRTNTSKDGERAYDWKEYLLAVQADANQAIRILRSKAPELGLDSNKVGVGGFSAGGNLALLATLYGPPKNEIDDPTKQVSGMPDFTGLFYPWFRGDYGAQIASRTAAESATRELGPIFIMNAGDDGVTPPSKCVDFYATLLKHKVNAELHVFSKGSHGFDLGIGRGESAAIWPTSFVAWLRDTGFIED